MTQSTQDLLNAATAAQATGDLSRATALCKDLLKRSDAPHDVVLGTLYNMHYAAGDARAAEGYARDLVARDPSQTKSVASLARALALQGRRDDAIAVCQDFIDRDETQPEIWSLVAKLHFDMKQLDKALDAIARSYAIDPNNPGTTESYLNLKLRAADWEGFEEILLQYRKMVASGHPLNPYALYACCVDPAELQAMARNYTRSVLAQAEDLPRWEAPKPRTGQKIRVGFYANTLRDHATGYLTREMFEQYDRSVFEFIAYPYNRHPQHPFTDALLGYFDKVVDLRDTNDAAAINTIRADDLDILVDVDAYANEARPTVPAARVAPVQVNWLGYLATTGSPFHDYIVADALVIPDNLARFYDEALARLPGGYCPDDSARPVFDGYTSRADVDLPEDKIVIAAFHQVTKILPMMLDAWAMILHRTPDAVLWLWDNGEIPSTNLKKAFGKRGIQADRLVFAPTVNRAKHLARIRFADLFLDTFPYNAHTTMIDVLSMDTPVVTVSGRTFASRVAGSLLVRLGQQECVARDIKHYVALASDLAKDASKRAAIRRNIAAAREKTQIFSGTRYIREFEMALAIMATRAREGRPPESFNVGLS